VTPPLSIRDSFATHRPGAPRTEKRAPHERRVIVGQAGEQLSGTASISTRHHAREAFSKPRRFVDTMREATTRSTTTGKESTKDTLESVSGPLGE
jgi:hypothetical protein